MHKKPVISVLVLTFNHAQFIESTLRSIVSQGGRCCDLEVIIIDDGSTDNTVQKIRNFSEQSKISINLVAKPHEGVASIAGNFLDLIKMASGDYISFLAGDDQYTPNRFVQQLECFNRDSNLVISYANGVNVVEGKVVAKLHNEEVENLLLSSDPVVAYDYVTSCIPAIFIQGILAKSTYLKKIQPFDRDLIADDWVFNIKVFDDLKSTKYNFNYLSLCVFKRNIHAENTSGNLLVHYRRISQVANRYCENRRAIISKRICNLIISSVLQRKFYEFTFFLKESFFYPKSMFFLAKCISCFIIRRSKKVFVVRS